MENAGRLPTILAHGESTRLVHPTRVEIDLPLLNKTKKERPGERLGDRTDLEQRPVGHRHRVIHVGHPEPRRSHLTVGNNAQGNAGDAVRPHRRLDKPH